MLLEIIMTRCDAGSRVQIWRVLPTTEDGADDGHDPTSAHGVGSREDSAASGAHHRVRGRPPAVGAERRVAASALDLPEYGHVKALKVATRGAFLLTFAGDSTSPRVHDAHGITDPKMLTDPTNLKDVECSPAGSWLERCLHTAGRRAAVAGLAMAAWDAGGNLTGLVHHADQ